MRRGHAAGLRICLGHLRLNLDCSLILTRSILSLPKHDECGGSDDSQGSYNRSDSDASNVALAQPVRG